MVVASSKQKSLILMAVKSAYARRLLSSFLDEAGSAEVVEAQDRDTAVQLLRQTDRNFALLIADPLVGNEQADLLKSLRWDLPEQICHLPVICILLKADEREVQHLTDAGADAVLAMPLAQHMFHAAYNAAVFRKKAFITEAVYRGPDRRVEASNGYRGPFRRAKDGAGPVNEDLDWSVLDATGIAEIDTEHRLLMKYVTDFKTAIDTGQSDAVIKKILQDIKKFIAVHFTHEEKIMDSFDYDDRIIHKKFHQNMLKKLEEDSLLVSDQRSKYLDIAFFIYDWLISHVPDFDQIMVAKFKNRGSTIIGADSGPDVCAAQTWTVISQAHGMALEVRKLSSRLDKVRGARQRQILCRRMGDISERMTNLMVLAQSRIQIHGCSETHVSLLQEIRAAVAVNAEALVEEAANRILNYSQAILSGAHGLPLGIGAAMASQMARVSGLLLVVGGVDALQERTKEAVASAAQCVEKIMRLEIDGSASLTNYDEPGPDSHS